MGTFGGNFGGNFSHSPRGGGAGGRIRFDLARNQFTFLLGIPLRQRSSTGTSLSLGLGMKVRIIFKLALGLSRPSTYRTRLSIMLERRIMARVSAIFSMSRKHFAKLLVNPGLRRWKTRTVQVLLPSEEDVELLAIMADEDER